MTTDTPDRNPAKRDHTERTGQIDLRDDPQAEVLYRLAIEIPCLLESLTSRCARDEVRTKLESRFSQQITIGDGGLVRLTEAACSDVLRASKPRLQVAKDAYEEAECLRADGAHEAATKQFDCAEAVLEEIAEALTAIDDVPAKMEAALRSAKDYHDSLRKRVAKAIIEMQVGHANGSLTSTESSRARSQDELKAALSGIQSAIDTAQRCNGSLLLEESSELSLANLQRRRRDLQRRLEKKSGQEASDSTGSKTGNTPVGAVRESAENGEPSTSPTTASRSEEYLEELRRLASEVGEPPTPTHMRNLGRYDASQVSKAFGTWGDAIVAAGVSDHKPDQTPRTRDSASEKTALDASAFETGWESIPDNDRLDEQLLVKVTGRQQPNGERKSSILELVDRDGTSFELDMWATHSIDAEFTAGKWYVLKHARGTVWRNDDGEIQKRLNSTNDLEIDEVGLQEPVRPSLLDRSHRQDDQSPSVESSRNPSTAASDQASENTEVEADSNRTDGEDILNDIMSDFEDM